MPLPSHEPSLPPALADSLDRKRLTAEEKDWLRLTAGQRSRALKRFDALTQWRDGKGDIDVEAAAHLAGVSPSRFYRIASEWRDSPSLASLGVFARGGPRKPKVSNDVVDALSKAARDAVLLHGDMSVSALVDRTLRLARLPPDAKLPGMTKLREIVQAEKRRIDAGMPMGQVILFDCVATSLPRPDGRPHIGFLCIDGGTGLVLGVSVGDVDHVVSGYASAASDALRMIGDGASEWPWSNVFSIMRLTAGPDLDRITKVTHELNVRHRHTNFILERGARRYGRLIGKAVGPRLGRVTFTPTRTLGGEALATNGDMTPWDDAAAYRALRSAADDHNGSLADADRAGAAEPPPGMIEALATIAGERD